MHKTPAKKMFTAELKRLHGAGVPVAGGLPTGQAGMMQSILQMREEIQELKDLLNQETKPDLKAQKDVMEAEHAELEARRAELEMMKTELRALANSIHQTKMEIAALRPANSDDDHIIVVTNELDAVVTSTEDATQVILDSAENIENLVSRILAQEKNKALQHLADDVTEQVTMIFEACNFQDITGQRITKVVNTLKFIEERIEAMMDIWGRENFPHVPAPALKGPKDERDDAHLLNGPQLADKGISQDDIDALFD